MSNYNEKSHDLPRFVYRNLREKLASSSDRASTISEFCADIQSLKPDGDWQKMKWCVPPELECDLTAEERAQVESALAAKRHRRNDLLIEVFPHCSDEFSTSTAFLDACFGSRRQGLIAPETRLFAMGSCFASNIARYMDAQGYAVTAFPQFEDLNSPFSNAKLLSMAAAGESTQHAYLSHWVRQIAPEHPDPKSQIELEMQRLEKLALKIRNSDFLIITCGNVLDYFLPGPVGPFDLGPMVAPKFLTIAHNEDIGQRTQLTARLKSAGAVFRLGNHTETSEAMGWLYRALRALNPQAHLLLTLSPVPIDSAIGAAQGKKRGAVELDCISKSLLRVCLAEFMEQQAADTKLHYFPSFEIVRWIAPCLNLPVFGLEDAASRHVSETVLHGVYRYFMEQFCTEARPAAREIRHAS